MELAPQEDITTMSSRIGLWPELELIQDKRKLFLVFCFFILFIIAVPLPFSLYLIDLSSTVSVYITLKQ